MPYSNPITLQEQQDLVKYNPLHPRDGSPVEQYMPPAYFLVPPATQAGPVKWRLFDAAYISTGIIDPNRLGTGATGAGNLYLADDGTWKAVGGGGGGGDMYKATYDVDNDGVVDSAETVRIIVRNSTGSTLLKGQVVYLSGATGNRPNAILAQANSEVTSSKTLGFVTANITNNSDGYVAVQGTLHDLDTSAFADGVAIWLSPSTAGGWTTTVPSEPNHSVFLGYVVRSHPTQGRVVILIQNGYELNELHDVVISSPSNNQLLRYNSAQQYWENWTPDFLTTIPTLDQVTTAGNTTTNAISIGGLTSTGDLVLSGNRTIRSNSNTESIYTWGGSSFANGSYFGVNGNNATNDRQKGAVEFYADISNASASAGSIAFGTHNAGFGFTWRALIFKSGNLLLTNTAVGTSLPTDAGYKLDVNGTIRVQNALTVTGYLYGGIIASASASNTFVWLNGTTDMQFAIHSSSINGFRYSVTGGNEIMRLFTSGNLLLQSGGTFTDAGYKLNVNGDIYANSHIVTNGNLRSMYQAGDEGGEITLNKPVTGTLIDTSVTIDIYQNKLRIFESGGLNRGGYFDISALANAVGTNLAPTGFTGTFTVPANPIGQRNLSITNGIITGID